MKNARIALAAALAICSSIGAAPAVSAQATQPASASAQLSENWVLGQWKTAGTTTNWLSSSVPYWLELKIERLPNGQLEATSMAQQMHDKTEVVRWKSDVSIQGDTLHVKVRELVGKPEWASYKPDSYELRRIENRLVGRLYSVHWSGEHNHLVEFER